MTTESTWMATEGMVYHTADGSVAGKEITLVPSGIDQELCATAERELANIFKGKNKKVSENDRAEKANVCDPGSSLGSKDS